MGRRKKVDIIQQLEEGKKLQEDNGIDEESLKTKITETEDNKDDKENNLDNKSHNQDDSSDTEHNSVTSNTNDSNVSGCDSEHSSEEKIEKYPGFDFSKMYSEGQTIFFVKVNSIIGTKEFMELKIRTIYPKMIVACTEKSWTQCIGPDSQEYIFTERYTASEFYDSLIVTGKVFAKDDLGDIDIKDTEE